MRVRQAGDPLSPLQASELNVPGDLRDTTKRRSNIQEIVETLLLAVLIFIAVRSIILNYRVDGSSMLPNLHDHEMLVVNRRAYLHVNINSILDDIPGVHRSGQLIWYPFSPPERGDIVIFNPPGQHTEPYIKRIIGLSGDHIAIHDGGVYINGTRLNEPYLTSDTVWRGTSDDYVVPAGDIFVLGDNRNNSSDSRVFGPVPITSVIGKAWVAYWPPSEAHILHDPKYNAPS
jgi:signal peptidase I